jgi:hypothetical protein
MEPRVVQPVVPHSSVQELRVVEPTHAVQEPRVVFPTLATANPVHTAPLAPLTIVALTSPPYPLPNTDKPNHLLGVPISTPTVPAAPATRRSERPHNKRSTSAIYAYFSVAAAPIPSIPAPYLAIVHGDTDI